jgi:hypothetical protein
VNATHTMIAMLAVAFLALLASAPPASAGVPEERRTILSLVATDLKVVLRATRGPGDGAPPATVEIAGFRAADGGWRSLGRLTVGRPNSFFWKVLTGPRSIRDLSFSPRGSEQVSFRLLITPSIGWSKPFRFHVEAGKLVRG